MNIPDFKSQKEKIKWLVDNKDRILTAKKMEMKRCDPLNMPSDLMEVTTKALAKEDTTDMLFRTIVINTTNLMDTQFDVLLPGAYSKSVKENKRIMHLQEHKMQFDHIITDGEDLKAYTRNFTWLELGANYPGTTEALLYDVAIRKSRNAYMFGEYQEKHVNNHSLGLQYVKILFAVNDKDYKEYYDNWKKYIDQVANKQDAIDAGFFYPIPEVKVIEGSAVPAGANWVTPTLENKTDIEPDTSTQLNIEPEKSTRLTSKEIQTRIKQFKIY